MTPHHPGWELYRSFLAVFREGSLSGAARALRVAQPTVGRHIDELEAALAVALFTRSPRGLVPTDTARELAPHAETMAAAAAALERAASGEAGGARGTVRITASDIVGAEVLPQVLTEFRERHPAVAIELVLSNRPEDLLRRDVDIAVRMVQPVQGALIATRVGRVGLGLYAHRRYLDVHGMPLSIEDLLQHAVIGFDRDPSSAQLLEHELGLSATRDMFALRIDNDLAHLAAIRAGFGIGVCQIGIARRAPDLVPVLPDALGFDLEMFVAMHEDMRASRRMRLMFDHLVAALRAYVASSQRRG